MNSHELAIKMIEKYGRNAQMLIVVEELVELQKEVLKCLRSKPNIQHLTEELADVEICLEQLKVMFPETVSELPRITQEKIDRTENEYLKGEKPNG